MKKIFIILTVFLCVNTAFSNDIIKHIDSAIHGQTYCIKGKESPEIKAFLEDHAFYSYNVCKKNEKNKKEFEELEKLASKNPYKYGFYLGMAYFLSLDISHKENNINASKWFIKSANLGNDKAKFRYCDTIDNPKKAFDCYSKIKSPQSFMAKASLFTSFEKQCSYIKKIDFKKYLDAYPFIVNCEMNLNENFEISKEVREKLKTIILNGETTFGSKLTSADILQNEKIFELLKRLNFIES